MKMALCLISFLILSGCQPTPPKPALIVEVKEYSIAEVSTFKVKIIDLKSKEPFWVTCGSAFPSATVGSRIRLTSSRWVENGILKTRILAGRACFARSK